MQHEWNRELELDPTSYVVSQNLHRRHLNETQRASVAAKLANMNVGKPNSANLQNNNTRAEVAKLLNISERSVNSAKKVQNKGIPELNTKMAIAEMLI